MNKPVSCVTARLHQKGTPATVSGVVLAPIIVIVALLLLAVFFYIRAISTSGEHAPQVAGTAIEHPPEGGHATADPAAAGGAGLALSSVVPATSQALQGKSETAPGDALNPDLVAALNSVVDPADATAPSDPHEMTGLQEVPAAQLDLIKRVFAPELSEN